MTRHIQLKRGLCNQVLSFSFEVKHNSLLLISAARISRVYTVPFLLHSIPGIHFFTRNIIDYETCGKD